MPEPLDPRLRLDLKNNWRLADPFRLVGRLTELAIKRSLSVGLGALSAVDLPARIEMRLDRLGVRQLQAHHDDRVLDVNIATYVREQLADHGVNVQQAIVADAGGEHDMIGDVVRRCHIHGQVFIELKCRRLWSEAGKDVAREAQRQEDVLGSKWWKKSKQDNPGKWGGRGIILFNMEGNGRLTSRCECHLADGSCLVWWGWLSNRLANIAFCSASRSTSCCRRCGAPSQSCSTGTAEGCSQAQGAAFSYSRISARAACDRPVGSQGA